MRDSGIEGLGYRNVGLRAARDSYTWTALRQLLCSICTKKKGETSGSQEKYPDDNYPLESSFNPWNPKPKTPKP